MVICKRTALWLMTAVMLCSVFMAANAQKAFAYSQDKVVFMSNRDGDNEIFIMNLDGTSVTKLTNNTFSDNAPAFSKGGARIAFSSNRDGDHEIYTMKTDGTDVQQLTDNSLKDESPAYSPHSNVVVFVRTDATNDQDIYALDSTDKEGVTSSLTGLPNEAFEVAADPAYNELRPSFADDGRMLYDRNGPTNREFVLLSDNFETKTLITPESSTISEWDGNFSRDGSTIIYTRGTGNAANIYKMNTDGTGRTALVNHSSINDHDPVWYPDESKIVYSSPNSGNDEIYTANNDGTSKTNISNNAASDEQPDVRTVTGDASYLKEVSSQIEESTSTHALSAGANDAEVTGSAYNGTATDITVRNSLSGGKMNGLISIDTSSVPDANVVNDAVLTLNVASSSMTDDFGVVVDCFNWAGNTSDFSSSQAFGNATAPDSSEPATIDDTGVFYDTGDQMQIQLDPTCVNKTGATKLRLRMIDNGLTNTGPNLINFASYENTTYAEPKLDLRYDNAAEGDSQKVTMTFGNEPANAVQAASFECKLDAGSWAACTSPKVYTGVSLDASHTVYLRAIDGTGTPEPSEIEHTFTFSHDETEGEIAYSPLADFLEPTFALLGYIGFPEYTVATKGAHLHEDAHEHGAGNAMHGVLAFAMGSPESESLLNRALTQSFRGPAPCAPYCYAGWQHWRSELRSGGVTDSDIFAHKGRNNHGGCALATAKDFEARTYTHKAYDCSYSPNQGRLKGNTTFTNRNHASHYLNVMPNATSRHGS